MFDWVLNAPLHRGLFCKIGWKMLKTTGDAKMQNDWVVVGLKKGIF